MTKGQEDPPGFAARLEEGILIFLLVSMIILSFTQIVLRNLFETGLIWIDPLVRQMLLWITLVGAMVATRAMLKNETRSVSLFMKHPPF